MESTAAPSLNAQALRAALTTLAAVAINLTVYALARLVGISLVVPKPGEGTPIPTQVPVGAVVSATVVGVVMGAVVLGIYRRFRPAGLERAFALTVALFTLLSLAAPLSLDTSLSNKLILASMHVLTAAVTVVGLVVVPLTSDAERA